MAGSDSDCDKNSIHSDDESGDETRRRVDEDEIPEMLDADDINRESPAAGRRSGRKPRKPQFRWNESKDLFLINEIADLRPFSTDQSDSSKLWKDIAITVNQNFKASIDHVAVQRRFKLLVKSFKSEDYKNRYKSGVEEIITQIKLKLAEIVNIMEDQKLEEGVKSAERKKKVESEKKVAEEIRVAATSTLKRNATGTTAEAPSKMSRRIGDSTLVDLWKEKQIKDDQKVDAEREVKLKELQLKERQLEFEKERFEFQKLKETKELELRERQLEIEKEEKQSHINTQNALMNMLIKKL